MSRSVKVATSVAPNTAKPLLGAPNGGRLTRRVVAAIQTLGSDFTATELATFTGIARPAVAIRIQNMVAKRQLEAVSLRNNEAVYAIRYLRPPSDPEAALANLMRSLRYEDHVPKHRRQHLPGPQATHGCSLGGVQPRPPK